MTKTQVQPDCDCGALALAAGAQPSCNYVPAGGGVNTSSGVGVGNYSDTVFPMSWVRTYSGNCEDLGTSMRITTGYEQITLSDLDTEANAIARLKAISNYTSWTNVGDGTGGTCLKTVCCTSIYEARSNLTFSYTESQYRANVFGLANSTSYTLIIEAWRRLHGVANYALYSYALTPFTTNATGFGSVIGDVPIQLGYDTYVTSPDVY